jgi:hypothetical protein
MGVKRQKLEADLSHSSGAEVKDMWTYISTQTYEFMARCLIKHRKTLSYLLTYLLSYLSSSFPLEHRASALQLLRFL